MSSRDRMTDWASQFRTWWLTHPSAVVDAAHAFDHFDAVWANCQVLATGTNADHDVLCAAAYFHDLVNLPKDHPQRAEASRLSAIQAERVLQQLDFPEAKLENVKHAIEAHSFSANIQPHTLEAQIVQDADRIEALGEIGLQRWQAVSVQLSRPLYDPADPFAARRPLDDSRWAVDHIFVKLLRLPGTMQTERGRMLANERATSFTDYLNALADQLNVTRPDIALRLTHA